jgi:crotonobetainyl-CoA:carnitine CoA-transferase CaiB-like acyl-CoA transferase
MTKGEVELAGGFICYRTYETKDGRYLSVGALEPKFWGTFCRLIGREDLIDAQADRDEDGRLTKEITAIFKSRTMDEWRALLDGHDTCIEKINTVAEAMNDPQMVHRNMIVELDHPTEGRINNIGAPIKLSETPATIDRLPAPAYGEHTGEVLRELGFDQSDIERFATEKVI